MDNLLLPLLNARNEQERQQRRDELLIYHVAPIIRQVLRQRLSLYVSAQGTNKSNHDAEDLYQEAMTRMVEVLHVNQRSLTTIENFERYVGRVVSNVCFNFLRSKSPTRRRLKDAVRDVFRRHSDLVYWKYENETWCGFAAWRNSGRGAADVYGIETRLNAFLSSHFSDEDVKAVPLSRIVAELLEWIGRPIQFDVMVRILAYVLDIREPQIESLDDHIAAEFEVNLGESIPSAELRVETNEVLERLWRVVRRLPPKQRDAFVLRFQDQAGRNLFTVLLTARIVDLKDLAEGLGRSLPDIVHLWNQMPMDSETAAAQLNTTRENIYKWRFRAIRSLKAELGEKSRG
jgi:RNA polymerase sigma factor (sigma-70 family)